MRLLLGLILVLFIIRAVLMLARGIMQGASGQTAGPGQPAGRASVQLMRDPVCGVYVSPSKAITEQSGVVIAYFCSERCRQAWKHR
jgi:YHS domain-containing protein